MDTANTPIEIDQEALARAAEVLGTITTKDTVNAALREVGQRLVRLRALARLGEMAERGDFDEFAGDKLARRCPEVASERCPACGHRSLAVDPPQSRVRFRWPRRCRARAGSGRPP
jgi:Arc/MetJ family transcription regulator